MHDRHTLCYYCNHLWYSDYQTKTVHECTIRPAMTTDQAATPRPDRPSLDRIERELPLFSDTIPLSIPVSDVRRFVSYIRTLEADLATADARVAAARKEGIEEVARHLDILEAVERGNEKQFKGTDVERAVGFARRANVFARSAQVARELLTPEAKP